MNWLDIKTRRILTFGKYKGKLVHDICWIDPSYLTWLENNTSFRMNNEEREHYREWVNKNKKIHDVHPGGEACCDSWESWVYGGAISPYGSDFM
jgi:hypothetical protein